MKIIGSGSPDVYIMGKSAGSFVVFVIFSKRMSENSDKCSVKFPGA